jgi:hypothetical protein
VSTSGIERTVNSDEPVMYRCFAGPLRSCPAPPHLTASSFDRRDDETRAIAETRDREDCEDYRAILQACEACKTKVQRETPRKRGYSLGRFAETIYVRWGLDKRSVDNKLI